MYFRPFTGAPISPHILWFDARDEDLVVGQIDPGRSEPPRPSKLLVFLGKGVVCLKGATERGKKNEQPDEDVEHVLTVYRIYIL